MFSQILLYVCMGAFLLVPIVGWLEAYIEYKKERNFIEKHSNLYASNQLKKFKIIKG